MSYIGKNLIAERLGMSLQGRAEVIASLPWQNARLVQAFVYSIQGR